MGTDRPEVKIQITDEMIEAGVSALCVSQDEISCRPYTVLASTVSEVYAAMARLGVPSLGTSDRRRTPSG